MNKDNKINNKFNDQDIFFVNPDIKRGMGPEEILPNYHILCTYNDPMIPILRKQKANIFCLEENRNIDDLSLYNNTGRLLNNPQTQKYILENSRIQPYIMYFKPSIKIDYLIKKLGYRSIGNPADYNEKFENKINSFNLFRKYFPNETIMGETGIFGSYNFNTIKGEMGIPFVIQFGNGWAGKTTFILDNEIKFTNLQKRFENTKIKISKYITGFTVLNNCTIYNDEIIISSPAIQIANITSLYPNPSVTCGRQWPVLALDKFQIRKIENLSTKIGNIMKKKGYKGIFGIDFIIDKNTGEIYISEINARMTASMAFYTKLEMEVHNYPQILYHIASFIGINMPSYLKSDKDVAGSQIIFRSEKNLDKLKKITKAGVFGINKNIIKFLRSEYKPANLYKNEFFYTSRATNIEKMQDSEISRLETKDEVLKSPNRLNDYYYKLIN
jgi:hypothetical protein